MFIDLSSSINNEVELLEFDDYFIKLEQNILNESIDNIKGLLNRIIEKLKNILNFISERIKKIFDTIRKQKSEINDVHSELNKKDKSLKFFDYAFLDDNLNFDSLNPISKNIFKFIESGKDDISGLVPQPDQSFLSKLILSHNMTFADTSSDDSDKEMYNVEIIEFIKSIYKFYNVAYSDEDLNYKSVEDLFNSIENDTISVTKEMVRKNISSYVHTRETLRHFDMLNNSVDRSNKLFNTILNDSKKALSAVQSEVSKIESDDSDDDKEFKVQYLSIKLKNLSVYTQIIYTLLHYTHTMYLQFLTHTKKVETMLNTCVLRVLANANKTTNEEAYIIKPTIFENIEFI